jgi:hypothetical protein
LDHNSNCPADGFHPSLSSRKHWFSDPFLLVLALFFFTVAIAPASVLNDPAEVGRSLSDELFGDQVHVICFEPTEALSSGITTDALSQPPDFDLAAAPEVSLETQVSPGVQGSFGGSGSATLAALASLPENRGVWLFAAGPWIWSVIRWYSPPARRRVRRRSRY